MTLCTCDVTTSIRFSVALLALLHAFPVFGSGVDESRSPEHRALLAAASKAELLTEETTEWHEHESSKAGNHAEHSACTDLVNHGTHFTVEIEVGTPGQKFDVVADTGSDAIIVPSCACVKAGYCNPKSRCFQGTNRSSTFAIQDGPRGPPTIRMMFGSGPVQAVVATDTVKVGKLHTKMQDGILLMTDQLLNIKGQFEGILGLGLPSADAKKGLYTQSPGSEVQESQDASDAGSRGMATSDAKSVQGTSPGKDTVVASYGGDNGVNIFPFPTAIGGSAKGDKNAEDVKDDLADLVSELTPTMNLAPTSFLGVTKKDIDKPKHHAHRQAPVAKKGGADSSNSSNSTGLVVKGFMEEAGINRFSMCFNDGANGVLRLGTPKVKNAHGSIGQVHWGLDFRGISVGSYSAPVEFCKPDNMTKGQKTPCGAIPDSGTTAFMAPKDHLIALYESICDRWDRCKKNYTAMVKAADGAKKAAIKEYSLDPFHIEPASKAIVFQQLMLDCRQWLTKDKGLNELPAIHFHIGGANDTKQTLNLKGWSYVIETQEKEFKYIYKNIPGLGKMPVGKNFTGHSKKVCSPAFSTMEYSTEQNGPVWILGTPIFYEYQVGYDMSSKPPQISFSNTPCGSCKGAKKPKTSLMSTDTQVDNLRRNGQPRQVNGPLRMPSLDFSQPL